ncbi:Transmembrane protein 205 [Lentinula edodes]|uniref:Transmembrane protein 205 n=1 Tax=Lentinula edodes TaxID=5353 RepID=A0A1Q3E8K2_LENED|nr:Transmembrane protein 205 [Lentinula edodes]
MSKVEEITISSFLSLFTSNGLYMILYSWLFGMSLWITFFGGVIAFKALPRQQFGNLQHKTFPIYFVISITLVYILFSVLISQGINYTVIGPLTSRTMFERHRLEKEEGKAYNEPGVSDAMKGLNRRFGSLHGISSLLNLWAVIAIGLHGLWIGNAGVKGY